MLPGEPMTDLMPASARNHTDNRAQDVTADSVQETARFGRFPSTRPNSTVSTPGGLRPNDSLQPRSSQEQSAGIGASRPQRSWTLHHIAILEWAEPRQETEGHA